MDEKPKLVKVAMEIPHEHNDYKLEAGKTYDVPEDVAKAVEEHKTGKRVK